MTCTVCGKEFSYQGEYFCTDENASLCSTLTCRHAYMQENLTTSILDEILLDSEFSSIKSLISMKSLAAISHEDKAMILECFESNYVLKTYDEPSEQLISEWYADSDYQKREYLHSVSCS